MNILYIRYIFILLLFQWFLPLDIQAQLDVSGNFDKIAKVFFETKRTNIQATYRWYPTSFSREPIDSLKGRLARDGDFLYSKFGNGECLTGPDHLIMVDHEEQFLLIQDVPETIDQMREDFLPYDSLSSYYTKTNYTLFDHSRARWTVYLSSVFPCDRFEVYFHPIEYKVFKVVMFLRESTQYFLAPAGSYQSPRIEIEYVYLPSKEVKKLCRQDRYVQVSKNKVKLAKKFANYRISNYLTFSKN